MVHFDKLSNHDKSKYFVILLNKYEGQRLKTLDNSGTAGQLFFFIIILYFKLALGTVVTSDF